MMIEKLCLIALVLFAPMSFGEDGGNRPHRGHVMTKEEESATSAALQSCVAKINANAKMKVQLPPPPAPPTDGQADYLKMIRLYEKDLTPAQQGEYRVCRSEIMKAMHQSTHRPAESPSAEGSKR